MHLNLDKLSALPEGDYYEKDYEGHIERSISTGYR